MLEDFRANVLKKKPFLSYLFVNNMLKSYSVFCYFLTYLAILKFHVFHQYPQCNLEVRITHHDT